jgi:YHS domain-containing protein
MTSARQKRNSRATSIVGAGAIAAVLAALGTALAPPARAGLTERIVVDWHSGLAIGGYDPVAFFTDGKPTPGSAKLELRYGGVVWRFCNLGNRAAFAERPDVYMPQYGGYDPVAIARGVAVAGNPDMWTIVGERLFLFYNADQREKFLTDSDRFIATATRKWPDVMRSLDP